MSESINPYEQERRLKLQRLRELGVDPFGQRTAGITPLATIKSAYQEEMGANQGPVMTAAGRVILKRDMGKLSFITLRDESGDLQIGIDKRRVSERDWEVRNLIDLGDQIVIEGNLGKTKKGEVTIWATSVTMASKALLPPPAKWEGLSDVELRYRQRYVDLWANPEVMQLARTRIRIIDAIRDFLRDRGFAEVETPMLQPMHGGAAARPFQTHHNALDMRLYLRIAPELYLKRLLVGGFSKVFEVNRNFRNEGISPRHNPEFTMLELYEAFGSYETMAELVETLICTVAQKVFGTLEIRHRDAEGQEIRKIDLRGDQSKPLGQRWRRVSMVDLVEERTGWKFDKRPLQEAGSDDLIQALVNLEMKGRMLHELEDIRHQMLKWERIIAVIRGRDPAFADELAEMLKRPIPKPSDSNRTEAMRAIGRVQVRLLRLSPAEQLVEVYEKLIEPTLIDPCFVTHVPSVIIPLAKANRDDPFFADVYELAINGQEISPGYTELNDPDVQAEHFHRQVGDEAERQKVDEDFLTALRYGMPPAGGLGLGIDRLIMMLTGAPSIRDVLLFPLMRPQE